MKTRINKYLVGALLCTITHNGYSMEAPKPEERPDILKKLDQRLLAEVNKTDNGDPITFVEIKIDGKDTQLQPLLKQMINKGDKGKDEALKTIISQLNRKWEDLSSDSEIRTVITDIFNGEEINGTKFKVNEEEGLTADNVNQLLQLLKTDETLKKLTFKQKKAKVAEVEAENGKFANETAMLYDKESTVTIDYLDPLDYKNSTNTIDSTPLGTAKIQNLLKTKYNKDYTFCEEPLGEDIIKYIGDKMDAKAPEKKEVEALIEGLYDHDLDKKDDASNAIIDFIIKYQHFQEAAKDKYQEAKVSLTKGTKLSEQINKINAAAGITAKDYIIKVDAAEGTQKFRKQLDKYLDSTITTYVPAQYTTPDENQQKINTLTDLAPELLLDTVTKMITTNETLEKEKATAEQKLTLEQEAKKTKEKEAQTYKDQLTAETKKLKAANETITKHEADLNKMKIALDAAEKEKTNQALFIKTFNGMLDDLTQLAGIKNTAKKAPEKGPAVFSAAKKALKKKLNEGGAGAKGIPEAQEKQYKESINKLEESVKELQEQNRLLTEEKNKLEQQLASGNTGGALDNAITEKDLEKVIQEFVNKDKDNNQKLAIMQVFTQYLHTKNLKAIKQPNKPK